MKEAKENPRYSQKCEAINFFYALSMDSSCYDEETGDTSEWVRHAVLFRFDKSEAAWLKEKELIAEGDLNEDGSATLGFTVDDQGNVSLIDEEEYRSIEESYNLAMNEREEEDRSQKAEDAFVLNLKDDGKAAYNHAGKAVFVEIKQDENASNPLEDWDGSGKMYSRNRNHSIFDVARVEDAIENNPDAVPLSCFEHGTCLWGIASELKKTPGVEFQWDGVEFAGVWIPDKTCIELLAKLEGQARKDKAREMASLACKAYTQYCNGEVYQYCVKIYDE
ncbi:MAG TPA: hypothetical protein VIJ46_04580, partial [Rhabdochlamydiaceae bacterium]